MRRVNSAKKFCIDRDTPITSCPYEQFVLYRKGMGFDSIGSLVLVAIVVLALFGLVPNRTRLAIERARKHEADRFSTSLHLVRIDDGSIIQGAKGTTMPQAVKQLSREQIEQVRSRRRASIRRRQILVGFLLVIAIALVVCARVFTFSMLWALVPVVLMAVVLFLGSRAAKVARGWEESVARSPKGVEPSQAGAVTTGEKSGEALSAPKSSEVLEAAPTYVIPVDDVREVLRKQAQEKAAAIAQRAMSRAENSEDSSDLDVEADDETSAVTVVASEMDIEDGEVSETDSAVSVASDTSDKDLISFSLGEDAVEAVSNGESVKSAEIKSYRQVAKAEPQSQERQQAIFADVAPSEVTLEKVAVEAPAQSEDSLGVDVDAVIARRQS